MANLLIPDSHLVVASGVCSVITVCSVMLVPVNHRVTFPFLTKSPSIIQVLVPTTHRIVLLFVKMLVGGSPRLKDKSFSSSKNQ